MAAHLLKAAHAWTDVGLGTYEVFHLRDKARREVDFLVTRAGRPWFLVEIKSSARRSLNPNLEYFQRVTGAAHAFQLAFDLPYVEADAFDHIRPVRVPAVTSPVAARVTQWHPGADAVHPCSTLASAAVPTESSAPS